MENPIKMDDLGGKPTISGNIHIGLKWYFWVADFPKSPQVGYVFSFPGGYSPTTPTHRVNKNPSTTHLKFNMAPEKLPSQKESNHPSPNHHFSGAMLNFGGVINDFFL